MTHYPGLVVAVLEGLVAGLVDEELLAPLLETVSFFLPSLFASSAAFFSSSVLVMNLRGLCRRFTWHQLTWPTREASWNSSFPPWDRTPLLKPSDTTMFLLSYMGGAMKIALETELK